MKPKSDPAETTASPGAAANPELALIGQLGASMRHDRVSRADLAAQIVTLRGERDRALVALAHSRAREALAWESAHHDTLTGLPNRLGFEAAWQQALAAHATGPRVFALLFIDLDGFKAINDRLGHAAGDELLAIVGARLSHALRRGDSVCRHGGDEFLCLLTQLRQPAEAHRIAEWLMHTIAAPCQLRLSASNGTAHRTGDGHGPGHPHGQVDGQVDGRAADHSDGHADGRDPHDPAAEPPAVTLVNVQPSIGIALYPRDGRSAPSLLDRADAAMYHAKTRHLGVAGVTAVRDLDEGNDAGDVGVVDDPKATVSGTAAVSRASRQPSRDGVYARAAAAPAPHRSSRRPRSPG